MSDEPKKTNAQSCGEIISDALMRSGKMKACLIIYLDEEGAVCQSFSCSRVERLGMLSHVFMHEQALAVRDVDDYTHESDDQ
jgi:hypothetical protein